MVAHPYDILAASSNFLVLSMYNPDTAPPARPTAINTAPAIPASF